MPLQIKMGAEDGVYCCPPAHPNRTAFVAGFVNITALRASFVIVIVFVWRHHGMDRPLL